MPPIAQRLREPAAFALLAYGAISTLFNTITFLFGPGGNRTVADPIGGGFTSVGPSFSTRAAEQVGNLLSLVVVAAVVGAVYLAHSPSHIKQVKVVTLASLITLGALDLFGVVALFSAFGADGPTGWQKTTTFFISLGELAVSGVGSWLVLGYFQQHQPPKPAGGFQQQWGPGPQQQAPQQQWQQPPTGAPQQQPWGPPPQQQAPQPAPPQQPQQQPQWGQPPQQDADPMMTQAIPTVPPAPQGQQQPPQQQPPQQDGGLPIGNWTSE